MRRPSRRNRIDHVHGSTPWTGLMCHALRGMKAVRYPPPHTTLGKPPHSYIGAAMNSSFRTEIEEKDAKQKTVQRMKGPLVRRTSGISGPPHFADFRIVRPNQSWQNATFLQDGWVLGGRAEQMPSSHVPYKPYCGQAQEMTTASTFATNVDHTQSGSTLITSPNLSTYVNVVEPFTRSPDDV
jgi:hypothetical protein